VDTRATTVQQLHDKVQEEIVSDLRIVLTTIEEDRADELARALVDERLAACVNVLGAMMSTYRWKGKVERASERQVLIKTDVSRVAEIERRFRELHPYELPEFIVIRPEAVSDAYAKWVTDAAG
jgi:periplasmic divalent cation tolerance protein